MAPSSSLVNKLKVQLKLSISRLRMVQQKDTALAKQHRREMAQLLEVGKIESARIRVENIIRSDLNTELLEIIELYCELLLARAGLLEAKDLDPGLEEAVRSIIFAAPRIEGVKELSTARQLLAEKFGKDFALAAQENADGKSVPDRVARKLKVEPPEQKLVEDYLCVIAEAYGVDYPPGSKAEREAAAAATTLATDDAGNVVDDDDDDDDEPSSGAQKAALEPALQADSELCRATPPRTFAPKSPVSVVPPSPSTENVRPRVHLSHAADAPSPSRNSASLEQKRLDGSGPGGKIPDVNELQKRFAMLKR